LCSNDIIKGHRHNKFLLDRLEKAHERNAEIRKQMMTMTFEDVIKTQKELAEYQEKIKKDKELIETFDKQSQVKLDSNLNGNTSGQDQQTR
jgi:hypothetical protein